MSFELPQVPVAHDQFIDYLARNETAQLRDLVNPYNEYEAKLREGFAQHRDHPLVQDPLVNAIPIYAGREDTLKIRARDPKQDPDAGRFIMPLKEEARRAHASSAMTPSLEEFKSNFKIFSEQSLDDLDWSNVVAAGSSVVTAMLPVPEECKTSKRALREHYHEKLAPSSDVDLFIWGLDEKAAIQKMAKIESSIRNCILSESTTIRTKNAITIVSQYPIRHIQIVLRLYKSVSEILTGFDVDCSCFAFDGSQVYATPRGITSFCSQTNTIDLSRRSPSYESRLAKYARRGFEIYYADFERKRIDPTVYERSLVRTLGLARLLILERLPTESDRERYMNQRRTERGRPPLDSSRNTRNQLPDNVKDKDPEDIADWVFDDEVSNYHTFTIPYGPKYNAKRIEKLLYVKDLLLNAEWNHKKDREVNLHRHPCFIGDVESIALDCCGDCPEPKTDEELKVAEEESKIYVHGDMEFMKDDPGRQAIGSFNPLTAEDWTDMAYLGNTQELCEFITSGNLEGVKQWCAVEENDVNHRDHTGRMPLHLAVMCGQLEILKVLIENGARITSRVQDGFTSLHMAASIGRADIIKVLAEKSEENEEMEAEKEDARKKERTRQQQQEPDGDSAMKDIDAEADAKSDSDTEMVNESDAETDSENSDDAMTDGSFYKVKKEEEDKALEDDPYGPDFFDMNVLAWDTPVSPLHVAILGGHSEAIEMLVSSFGADVLLPIKLKSGSRSNVNQAILNLVLASRLTKEKSVEIIKTLIGLGAKPSQSDVKEVTAAHGATLLQNVTALKAMAEHDLASTQAGLNHIVNINYAYSPKYFTALVSAIFMHNEALVKTLLECGAKPDISFEDFREVRLRERKQDRENYKELLKTYNTEILQPIIYASMSPVPGIVLALLDAGVDVNSMDAQAHQVKSEWKNSGIPRTVLDYIRANITSLNNINKNKNKGDTKKEYKKRKLPDIKPAEKYLKRLTPGSYRHTMVSRDLELAKLAAEAVHKADLKSFEDSKTAESDRDREKREELEARIKQLEELEAELVKRGGKTFYELYPDLQKKKNDKEKKSDNHGSSKKKDDDEEKKKKDDFSYYVSGYYNDDRLTGEREKAYLKLFEAAWEGDIDTVKALTLHERDDDVEDEKEDEDKDKKEEEEQKDEEMEGENESKKEEEEKEPKKEEKEKEPKKLPPLLISTKDSWGLSILGIALVKGNFELAQVILDIAAAQYAPEGSKKATKWRFRISGSGDVDSDYEYEPDEVPVTSELVDDDFTIEDLSGLNAAAGSKTSPADMLLESYPLWAVHNPLDKGASDIHRKQSEEWKPYWYWRDYYGTRQAFDDVVDSFWLTQGLLDFAFDTNNTELTKFLMRAAKGAKILAFDEGQGMSSNDNKWRNALENMMPGCISERKWDLLELLITETGVAMPISDIFGNIAVPEEERKKPVYYQGLKIRGKYKTDWAAEAGGEAQESEARPWRDSTTGPFLDAVKNSSPDFVDFWKGPTAVAWYDAFGQKNKDVKSIQRITKEYGSWKKAVSTWIGLRKHLALHAAVLRKGRDAPKDDDVDLVKPMLELLPGSLDKKSSNGMSPLWLAFKNHQVEAAKLLIDAGADQTTRNNSSQNILHALLLQEPRSNTKEEPDRERKDLDRMEALIKLIDPQVLPDLFTGRSNCGPTGRTPLAEYMSGGRHLGVLRLLARYSPPEPYTMFDGSGQTPAHHLVIAQHATGTRAFLYELAALHPAVLLQDNAMGQLPVELAWTLYLRHQTTSPPEIPGRWNYSDPGIGDLKRPAEGAQRSSDRAFIGDHDFAITTYRTLRELTDKATRADGLASGVPKRHIISVRDAREVARRLAARMGGNVDEEDEEVLSRGVPDEISRWN